MIKIKIKANLDQLFDKEIAKKKRSVLNTLVHALKEETPVDTGEARDGWVVKGNAIVNEVEHVSYLNEGSSQQAPAHFIERTLLSHPAVSPSGTIVQSTN